MSFLRHPRTETGCMVLLSAMLFVALFRLNDWLFAALEHSQGVNWIFLPAGLRVALVLVMGLPAAFGILLGNLWLDREHWALASMPSILAIGLASGFGPWLVRVWMEKRQLIDTQLQRLNSASLLHFVLLYAAFNALSHQLIHWVFQTPNTLPWLDVWPMFVGDAIGALVVLYAFKVALAQWRRRQVPRT